MHRDRRLEQLPVIVYVRDKERESMWNEWSQLEIFLACLSLSFLMMTRLNRKRFSLEKEREREIRFEDKSIPLSLVDQDE